jgi:putative transposase
MPATYFFTEGIMSSTYLGLHFHLVFSTKNRKKLLLPEWQPVIHDYMGGIVKGLGGFTQGVGGVADHVHLLFGLKATHCLADFMRELKKQSARWIQKKYRTDFQWQEGYSAFTVSPTARKRVRGYIANQAKHHRQKSFREELIELLKKAEIEFDPQYLD